MGIEVHHESAVALTEYARIAIAFEVNEVLDVWRPGTLGR